MTLRTFQDIITNKSSVRSVPNAPPISKKTVTKRHIFNAHIVSPSETSHVSDTRPQKTQAALKKAEKQAKIVAARKRKYKQLKTIKTAQNKTHSLIPFTVVRRMLNTIMEDVVAERFKPEDTHFPRQTAPRAIWMMSYVMEFYLLGLLENTNKVANHSKRLTICDRDVHVVNYIERFKSCHLY